MAFDIPRFGLFENTLPEGSREDRLNSITRNMEELGYGG
jgi:hypothetical protein